MKKIIMHVDVNNAFLSWTACNMLKNGEKLDIRKIPSIIGGDEDRRAGIVLAKSEIAKKLGIKTAETIYEAKTKCKNLKVFLPDFKIYSYYSNSMYNILCKYSDKIERYSIDECFLDYTSMQMLFGNPFEMAQKISKEIFEKLGFTVNVGIGNNKFLAKMASELEKPNKINTIYYNEIQKKLWPLQIEDMFMVGRKTVPELKKYNIYTIGDLAKFNRSILKKRFGKFGEQIYNYANGIDNAPIEDGKHEYKGISNSMTTNIDVKNKQIAYANILSISECVSKRLREEQAYTSCICINIKFANFEMISHQRKILKVTNSTNEIYEAAKELFDEIWKGQSIRSFGIRLDKLVKCKDNQISFFDIKNSKKKNELDSAIDYTRNKYGLNSVKRAIFVNSYIDPILKHKE